MTNQHLKGITVGANVGVNVGANYGNYDRTSVLANDGATEGTGDGANVGATVGATDRIKEKLSVLLKAIVSNEGKRIPDYQNITKLGSHRTIERYIQQLRKGNLIEFKGDSPHTGGYYLTELLKEKLK